MRKDVKFKRGIISILLILGLVLTNLSPLGAWAEEAMAVLNEQRTLEEETNVSPAAISVGNNGFTQEMLKQALDARNPKDVSKLFPDEKIAKKVVQDGKVLGDDTKVDTSKLVSVTLNFNVPVIGDFKGKVDDITKVDPDKYVISGDTAKINVGVGIKLRAGEKYEFDVVDKENNKIGKAVFREKDKNVVVDFDFEGTAVYDGTREEVKVELAANFDLDTSTLPPVPGENETIEILGKKYKIEKPADHVIVTKTGEVNYTDNGTGYYGKDSQNNNIDKYKQVPDNMSITWTVTVSRKGVGGNPLPLAGYKFTDNLKPVGKYQTDTFKVNDVSTNAFTYNENTGELSYVFPEGNATEATIKFNTRLTWYEFKIGTTKRNTANIFDKNGKYVGGKEGVVEWKPQWGEKNAKKYGNASFRKEYGKYYIDWQILFNKNGYNLTNVRIVDELKNATDGTATIFEKAVLEKYVDEDIDGKKDGKLDWLRMREFNAYPTVKEQTHPQYRNSPIFEVGNISFPIRLTITVKVDPSAILSIVKEFTNYAIVLWGSDWLVDFSHSIGVGEGRVITKKAVTKDNYHPFDHVWNITVNKNDILDRNKTFAYDAMIFDPNVNMWNISKGHEDTKLRVKGEDGSTRLQSGIELKKIIFEHAFFNQYLGFESVSPNNLQHKKYQIFLDDKYVGDVIEVWNFDKSQDNTFRIKARVVTPNLIMGKVRNNSNYNRTYLIHEGKEIDKAHHWPSYRSRMLQKQALTAETAKKIIAGDTSSKVVNEHVYDAQVPEAAKDPQTEKKAVDNKLTAYNKDDNSIIYRISVNAAGIHDISDYIGETVIEDVLPETAWKFAPIKGSDNYLLYEGESFANYYSREAVVEAKGSPIQGLEGFSAEVNGQKAKFTFKKLDKPYVILLKVQLIDDNAHANDKGTLKNTASLTLKGSKITSSQDVDYDRRSLNKDLDAKNIDKGYITWTIEYKPYKFKSDKPPYMEDKLGEGLEIRRNANGKLSFNNDNYQLIEGRIDNNGKFKEVKKLSTEEELKDKLSYDAKTRILTIKNFDKDKAYRFIYITDVIGKVQGEIVSNIVTLKEGEQTTNKEAPKEYYISKAYGHGSSKGFVHFTIHKVNEEGNENLEGAEFELTYPSPSKVKKILKTGTDGKVKSEALRLRETYWLKEIKAPAGYQLDSTVYEVKINELTQGFEVELVGNNNPLVSASGSDITVKNRKKVIAEADVTLIKADIIDASKFNASLSLDDIKHPLANAEFRLIKKGDPAVSHSAVTGTDGKLKFTGVKKGTYLLKEEKAPEGYASLMTKEYEVTVNPDAAVGQKVQVSSGKLDPVKEVNDTIVVFNKKYNEIKLVKADIIDKNATKLSDITKPLDGAEFNLTGRVSGGKVISLTNTTTKGGILTFSGLEDGTYKLKETAAPEGYAPLIDKEEYEITVTRGAIDSEVAIKGADGNKIKLLDDKKTVVVFNEILTGLEIIKADIMDSEKALSDMRLLGGAKFKLTSVANQALSWTATTATQGATKGKLVFKGIKKGNYTLKELEAPQGYALPDREYKLTVTPGAVNTEPEVRIVSGDVDVTQQGNKLVIFNEKVLDFTLIKASLADKDAVSVRDINNRLPGAKFKLISKVDNTVSYSAITNVKGEWTFKNLKTGVYELKEEAAPNGYNALMGTCEVEVTATPEKSEINIVGENVKWIRKFDDTVAVVFNEKQENSFDLDLVKADISDRNAEELSDINHPLEGAEFSLVLKANPVVSRSAATVNGKLKFTGVEAGVYTLKEVKAPTGYASLMDEYEVTVTPGAVLGTKVAIKNAKSDEIKTIGDTIVVFNEKTYNLKLLKADLDVNKDVVTKEGITLGAIKTPLNGARFRLVLKNNSAVSYSALTGDSAASAGSLTFKGLKSGVYTLTEETAPGGYTGISQSYEITVTATAINTEFAIKDAKEGEIRKVDDAVVVFNKKNPTPPPIIPENPGTPDNPPTPPTPPNPTPNIPSYPADNPPDPNDPNSPDEFVAVDDEGTPQGKYVKSKKPDGTNEYIPVDEDGTPLGVNKAKKKLPKTGGSDSMVYYAGGIMFILLAAGMVVVKRKKYNE